MINSARSGFMGLGVLFVLARAAQAEEAPPVATAGAAANSAGSASLPQQVVGTRESAPGSPDGAWADAQRQRAQYEIRAGTAMLPIGAGLMMLTATVPLTQGYADKLGPALFFGAGLGPAVHLAGIGAIAAGSVRLRELDRGGPEHMTATGRWLLTRGSIVTGVGLGISLLSLSALSVHGPSSGPGIALATSIPIGFGAPLLLVGGYMMAIGGALMSDLRSPPAFAWSFSPYRSPQGVGLTLSLVHK